MSDPRAAVLLATWEARLLALPRFTFDCALRAGEPLNLELFGTASLSRSGQFELEATPENGFRSAGVRLEFGPAGGRLRVGERGTSLEPIEHPQFVAAFLRLGLVATLLELRSRGRIGLVEWDPFLVLERDSNRPDLDDCDAAAFFVRLDRREIGQATLWTERESGYPRERGGSIGLASRAGLPIGVTEVYRSFTPAPGG